MGGWWAQSGAGSAQGRGLSLASAHCCEPALPWEVESLRWAAVSLFQRGPPLSPQRPGSHGDQPMLDQAPGLLSPRQAAEPTVGGPRVM